MNYASKAARIICVALIVTAAVSIQAQKDMTPPSPPDNCTELTPRPVAGGQEVAHAYYQDHVVLNGETINAPLVRYVIYVPQSYDSTSSKVWPCLFAFPSSGQAVQSMSSTSSDNDFGLEAFGQMVSEGANDGIPFFITQQGVLGPNTNSPPALFDSFVVISPFVHLDPPPDGWEIKNLACMVRDCISRFKVDKKRVYLSGHCAGSRTAQFVARLLPQLPAALALMAFPEAQPDSLSDAGTDFSFFRQVAQIPTALWINNGDDVLGGDAGALAYKDTVNKIKPGNFYLHEFDASNHSGWFEPYQGVVTYPEMNNLTYYGWMLTRSLSASSVLPQPQRGVMSQSTVRTATLNEFFSLNGRRLDARETVHGMSRAGATMCVRIDCATGRSVLQVNGQ